MAFGHALPIDHGYQRSKSRSAAGVNLKYDISRGDYFDVSEHGLSHRVLGKFMMEYVRVGDSGLYVSKVILGTAGFGSSKWQSWVAEEEVALPVLKYAFDKGINTWDTADAYSNGQSEILIGKAIKKYNIPREQLVIMTKIFYALDSQKQSPIAANMDKSQQRLVNRVGLSRKHILAAVAESVARLGTYIDVLQIHRLDRDVSAKEIMKALHDVVESGQVRYLGASSMSTWEFQKLQYTAERNGWHMFISMQGYYNLLYREEEREMIPFCKDSGIGLMPWSPLARGVLSRPWLSRQTKREAGDTLLQSMVRGKESPADEIIVSRVEEIAQKHGVNLAAVALTWCRQNGVCPITGLGSEERIDQAIESLKLELSGEEIQYLEEPYLPREVMY